ncbi:hypothetical protein HJC23_005538 [Cyclotella cryptica]|uniref:Bromo domain-containing protein n=1 Tax=Cyclotella cryptica TaxID=29204 RepID=A0ABD3PX54_9STRA|eukprot:CCRYP_010630-RA/>CCRYP_010630-RA protein AED:0.33 eAED:0.33 QI:255/1/1/1/1/1/2/393/215
MSSPAEQAMSKLVSQFYAKAEAEPFREPVDWKSLGLFDYPQVVKKPMDLGQVKKNLNEGKYKSIHEAAADVRLIWKNCMTYNADGSDFYLLAQNMSKKFEEKFAKLLAEHGGEASSSEGGEQYEDPTPEEKRTFAKLLYKISKEELGTVITDLDAKCPTALVKNSAEDEVEINVDSISPKVFSEIMAFVKKCTGDNGAGGGKKKKVVGKKSKPSN